MSKNEEIFRFVVANQALEGMVMTDDEKIVLRNQQIIIESHEPEMKNYRDSTLRYIYDWAKINGYTGLWKPGA